MSQRSRYSIANPCSPLDAVAARICDVAPMKQYVGDEIRQVMADMPHEVIEGLQAQFREHMITEAEARWWGFLMFARTGSYEGTEYSITAMGTGAVYTERFAEQVLEEREGRQRFKMAPRQWPDPALEARRQELETA